MIYVKKNYDAKKEEKNLFDVKLKDLKNTIEKFCQSNHTQQIKNKQKKIF